MNDSLSGIRNGNWPRFHCVTVYDFLDRHDYMTSQFEKRGVSYVMHKNYRFKDMNPKPMVSGEFIDQLGAGIGIVISHLTMLANWYILTDEEYAIFIEDDHDISNIQFINWEHFYNNLPLDWECVQLVRIESPLRSWDKTTLHVDMRYGRWWGGASLMRRSWVKKILDRHIIGDNTFKLDIDGMLPMIENVLFYNLGTIYNFPLFYENINIPGTVKECSDIDYIRHNIIPHKVSALKIMSDWAFITANENGIDYKSLFELRY